MHLAAGNLTHWLTTTSYLDLQEFWSSLVAPVAKSQSTLATNAPCVNALKVRKHHEVCLATSNLYDRSQVFVEKDSCWSLYLNYLLLGFLFLVGAVGVLLLGRESLSLAGDGKGVAVTLEGTVAEPT